MAGRAWRLGGVAGVLVVGALLAGLAWLATTLWFTPGGAAAYQDVPPRVLPDGAVRVTLRVAVWGAGGPAAGRFSGMRLQVRAAAAGAEWQDVPPEAAPDSVPNSEGRALDYHFAVPAAVGAGFEYRFRYAIDGVPQDVPGRFGPGTGHR